MIQIKKDSYGSLIEKYFGKKKPIYKANKKSRAKSKAARRARKITRAKVREKS